MTAEIFRIGGLRSLNLARYQTAMEIIARNMRRPDPEDVLRSMRAHLAAAAQEPTWERGQAQCAMAANRLAAALRLAHANNDALSALGKAEGKS